MNGKKFASSKPHGTTRSFLHRAVKSHLVFFVLRTFGNDPIGLLENLLFDGDALRWKLVRLSLVLLADASQRMKRDDQRDVQFLFQTASHQTGHKKIRMDQIVTRLLRRRRNMKSPKGRMNGSSSSFGTNLAGPAGT